MGWEWGAMGGQHSVLRERGMFVPLLRPTATVCSRGAVATPPRVPAERGEVYGDPQEM